MSLCPYILLSISSFLVNVGLDSLGFLTISSQEWVHSTHWYEKKIRGKKEEKVGVCEGIKRIVSIRRYNITMIIVWPTVKDK